MAQSNEAIARYNRILESEELRDGSWISSLHEKLKEAHLYSGGRPVSPVLRPHFITSRQYANLIKVSEALYGAIDRTEKLALDNPALMSRMQMLPAEKLLASINPGYSYMAVTALLDTHINNGSLHVLGYQADTPAGVIYGEALNNVFYEAEPVRELRKKYKLTKVGGTKPLVESILKAYGEFGGRSKNPNIGILEFRQPFQSADLGESQLLAEFFRQEGYATEVVTPDQLEYRNGVLRKGAFQIDVIYRRVRVSEFLVRFDLNQPLVRAYRERAVCVVNSFRSELAQKRAIFDLLTDDRITRDFPAAERKAVRDFIPWTRVVSATKTTHNDEEIDLLDFIRKNREKLVLRPNDGSDERTYIGAELDEASWDRAMKQALRSSYVVQEVVPPNTGVFPVLRFGQIEMQELVVDVHPHSFLGKVEGCSTWVKPVETRGFSSVTGLAPTFIIDPKV
ncbi:MAG TPA: hypothetical protein VE621_04280 [Bryobacteraceae bacterium]|nr:hypothetical protein [Bryobacteraceae bacterium]